MKATIEIDRDAPFDRVFCWKNSSVRARFYGRRCRILANGASMRSVLIEFEDGERTVTSIRALKRA